MTKVLVSFQSALCFSDILNVVLVNESLATWDYLDSTCTNIPTGE